MQLKLVILLGILYTIWGVWHHRKSKYAMKKLIVEYSSMGILIIALFVGYLVIFNF